MAPTQARRNFARRKPTRKAKDTVLIVCEGEKTEPNYFEELKRDLGLSNMDIVIYGKECDSDPMSVVRHALAECKKADHGFDYVFAWLTGIHILSFYQQSPRAKKLSL